MSDETGCLGWLVISFLEGATWLVGSRQTKASLEGKQI